jgi:hypothetical protein
MQSIKYTATNDAFLIAHTTFMKKKKQKKKQQQQITLCRSSVRASVELLLQCFHKTLFSVLNRRPVLHVMSVEEQRCETNATDTKIRLQKSQPVVAEFRNGSL